MSKLQFMVLSASLSIILHYVHNIEKLIDTP
jgi:hypothetical protein